MKTLILCVDRDDDLGQKVGVISPVVGRKDNLRAAIALALKDPEDSDVNSIFAALQEYDQKVNENQDVEIATICGDKDVGTRSDQILAAQLESGRAAARREETPGQAIGPGGSPFCR